MKKHIGFLIMNFSNGGGTERVSSVIADNLAKKDYQISVISCREGEKSCFPIGDGIKLFSLHGEQIRNPVFRKIGSYQKLEQLVKDNKIDIMVAVDVALYLYLWPLQKKHICKCIAWEHFNYYISQSKAVKWARKLAAAAADCVIVLGKNDLNNYKNHYKRINRIEYIYNPIALSLEKTTTMEAKRVIAVGRLTMQKGFDMLIDAWSLIESKKPDWTLDIFGEGPLKEELLQQIAHLKLKNIHLCGYAEDIEKEYINSSIFALSSRYEGFVLVLMEAQAKALPCVSFNCKEGPAETIDDGINGFLVEEGNIAMFAEKLEYLMYHEAVRKEFSEKAGKDLGRFDTEAIMDKWEAVINSL